MKTKLLLMFCLMMALGCSSIGYLPPHKLENYTHEKFNSMYSTTVIKKGHPWNQFNFKYPIMIQEYGIDKIGNYGGVEVLFNIFNCRDNVIKYIYISIVPKDNYGVIQSCDMDGSSVKMIKITGPIKKNLKEDQHISLYDSSIINIGIRRRWYPLWYNSSIRIIEVLGLKVVYEDGSYISFTKSEIDDMIALAQEEPIK